MIQMTAIVLILCSGYTIAKIIFYSNAEFYA